MEQEKAKFKFIGYKITHSEIDITELSSDNLEYSLDINAKGQVKKDRFILEMEAKINSNDNSLKASIQIIGEFKFDRGIDDNLLDNLFCANAPAIIFPYIRSYISTLTALSGGETVIIPTLNMVPLGQKIKNSLNID